MAPTPHDPGAGTQPEAEPEEPEDHAGEAPVAEELLVEEISIDGMCGVY